MFGGKVLCKFSYTQSTYEKSGTGIWLCMTAVHNAHYKDKSKGTNLMWHTVCLYIYIPSWFMFFISFHFIGKWFFFFIMCWIYWSMMVVRKYPIQIHWMLPRCRGIASAVRWTLYGKSKAFKWRIACGWRRVLPSPHTVRRRYAS